MGSSKNLPLYEVFVVTENDYWLKIGAVWPSKSGKALNVKLEALPIDGRLVLMEPKTDSEKKTEADDQQ
jgi:hypothetical protein